MKVYITSNGISILGMAPFFLKHIGVEAPLPFYPFTMALANGCMKLLKKGHWFTLRNWLRISIRENIRSLWYLTS